MKIYLAKEGDHWSEHTLEAFIDKAEADRYAEFMPCFIEAVESADGFIKYHKLSVCASYLQDGTLERGCEKSIEPYTNTAVQINKAGTTMVFITRTYPYDETRLEERYIRMEKMNEEIKTLFSSGIPLKDIEKIVDEKYPD